MKKIATITDLPFHPVIVNWFEKSFDKPSPPQAKGWPVIAAGQHTLILAPTGSGKTLSAFLWCLDEIFRAGLSRPEKEFAKNASGVHTLYISPLKALNNDIQRNLQQPLEGIKNEARSLDLTAPGIRVLVRTGDTPSHVRQSMVKKPPHILITTPESLYLLLTSLRGREIFRNLRYLIVDEIHALSNNKRGVHLSLSLERLMVLCPTPPVRIGLSATQRPLERIAAFLGGQRFDQEKCAYARRPVTIVDCGQRKALDLQVISVVEDFGDLPEASVWPEVIAKLYDLIRTHRTTLIFANMRTQTEKIARQLNDYHRQATGEAEAELALAHHGSISREARYSIEARLKAGQVPAVVATSTLELGIDIGSIDLVVQLGSPQSISGALQRIGRSGHLLQATSKGRIIPLYPADLDDSLAIAGCVLNGDIEESVIPENCLDVLSQQITAEVAVQDWPRLGLFRQFGQSYCYRNLSETAFNNVLEMLAGRFAETMLKSLRPRLTWDKVNDRLIAHRGARLQATINGGTIPDRGNYSVYLAGSKTRLGEVDEEFVFESRPGEIFFLGNNEWRIEEIKQDRLIVTPLKSIKSKPPFWKADPLFRDYDTSSKIGAFRREFLERLASSNGAVRIDENQLADEAVINNLAGFLTRQRGHTGMVPTDRHLVGEWFQDAAGESYFMLHAPFGARVNGAWAIALVRALELQYRRQFQYMYDDDGILIRFMGLSDLPALENLLQQPADAVEKLLLEALAETPIFSIYFRQNAGRALLLPRSRTGKRMPLWLQRLRAADLLQSIRKYSDFPILVETYRQCLQNVFDLPRLRLVINRICGNCLPPIKLHFVQTNLPSPMTAGLMFRFESVFLYDYDQTRYPGQAAAFSSELLSEILAKDNIPAVVTAEIVEMFEKRMQHLYPENQVKDVEGLFALIEKLGPIDDVELQRRCAGESSGHNWLEQLVSADRIIYLPDSETGIAGLKSPPSTSGWISAIDRPLFVENPSDDIAQKLIRRILSVRGPLSIADVQKCLEDVQKCLEDVQRCLEIDEEQVRRILTDLQREKEVVKGLLVIGRDEELWCDRQNFARLYRQAIAAKRQTTRPAGRETFYRFLLRWHRFNQSEPSILDLIRRYSGFKLARTVFEREILAGRNSDLNRVAESTAALANSISRGEVIVRAKQNLAKGTEGRRQLDFILRGEGHIFYDRDDLTVNIKEIDDFSKPVFNFLRENGASFSRDIQTGTDLSIIQVQKALSNLVNAGLVSCDDYHSFLSVLQPNGSLASEKAGRSWDNRSWLPDSKQSTAPGYHRYRQRKRRGTALHKVIQERIQIQEGRWFLLSSFAIMGRESDRAKRAEKQAVLLLRRYGILVKDWYRHERGLLPWFELFRALKRLEWQGEIRRGYFVEGLSGIQFALPEALELLQNLQIESKAPHLPPLLICTVDPALPFGGAVKWDLSDRKGRNIQVTRAGSNHLIFIEEKPVVYGESFGSRLWLSENYKPEMADEIVKILKRLLQIPTVIKQKERPGKKLEVLMIDDQLAIESDLKNIFVRNGFEQEGNKLVLWPSGL